MDTQQKILDSTDLLEQLDLDFTDSITLDLGHGAAGQPVYSIDSGSGTMFTWDSNSTILSSTLGSNTTMGTINNWSWANTGTEISAGGLMDLRGVDADIRINGESIVETLQAIKERLNYLRPCPELEAEWDELRELGDRYRELEARCREKSKMWQHLKQMPPPEKL
jgi:hypothetical protein